MIHGPLTWYYTWPTVKCLRCGLVFETTFAELCRVSKDSPDVTLDVIPRALGALPSLRSGHFFEQP